MKKGKRKYPKKINDCGSRRGKGGCTWGGATKLVTIIKIAA